MPPMPSIRKSLVILTLALGLGTACYCVRAIAADRQNSSWAQELSVWRAQHAAELQKPDGWLALAGLVWLEPGDNPIGSANDNKLKLPASGPAHVGILHLDGTTVSLRPPAGAAGFPAGLLVDGKPAQAQELHTNPGNDKGNPRMTIGDLNFYAVQRSDKFALRIKDAKSAALVGFHGLNWYRPDARYRVTAKWIPYSPPRKTKFVTMIGTDFEQPVPGVAEFQLGGKTYRLEPMTKTSRR